MVVDVVDGYNFVDNEHEETKSNDIFEALDHIDSYDKKTAIEIIICVVIQHIKEAEEMVDEILKIKTVHIYKMAPVAQGNVTTDHQKENLGVGIEVLDPICAVAVVLEAEVEQVAIVT